jgi:hypothetical protein
LLASEHFGERLADCAGTYDCVAHQFSCVSVDVEVTQSGLLR